MPKQSSSPQQPAGSTAGSHTAEPAKYSLLVPAVLDSHIQAICARRGGVTVSAFVRDVLQRAVASIEDEEGPPSETGETPPSDFDSLITLRLNGDTLSGLKLAARDRNLTIGQLVNDWLTRQLPNILQEGQTLREAIQQAVGARTAAAAAPHEKPDGRNSRK